MHYDIFLFIKKKKKKIICYGAGIRKLQRKNCLIYYCVLIVISRFYSSVVLHGNLRNKELYGCNKNIKYCTRLHNDPDILLYIFLYS